MGERESMGGLLLFSRLIHTSLLDAGSWAREKINRWPSQSVKKEIANRFFRLCEIRKLLGLLVVTIDCVSR